MGHDRDVRTILGVPFLPPPRLSRAVVALRRSLGRAQRAAVPPFVSVLEGLFGLVDNRALGLLVELDVPDHLDRPRTTEELAEATGTSPDALARLLRYSAGRGFVDCDRSGRWRANAVTQVLTRDHPNSWRGWVELAGSAWFWDAWRYAPHALQGKGSGVEAATGWSFFDFVNRADPAAGEAFNRAMAAGATVQALALDHALDWSAVRTVCDVGGGTGAALEFLLSVRPQLEGVLFDLPEVVAAARPGLTAGDVGGRYRGQPGDFFDSVPGGADRYLLLAVVHDWGDAEARRILSTVRAALSPTARAVVVESVRPERPRGEFVEASDLLMLVMATGRERTAAEYAALFSSSGLELESEVPLATGFTAFVLAPSGAPAT